MTRHASPAEPSGESRSGAGSSIPEGVSPGGTTPPSGTASRAGDTVLRWVGALVAVIAAVVTAMVELFWAPLRIGGQLVGVSVVLAVVGNVALAWFARRAVGHVGAVALPAVAWFVVMMAAATRTREGDILLIGNWVGGTMIFAGSVAFAVTAFRMIVRPGRSVRG
ncbi:MAG TPA: hypothetical protein VFX60_12410 [Micromonospora sp.]|nr:hypothetical protein [Micromonospora sp.]